MPVSFKVLNVSLFEFNNGEFINPSAAGTQSFNQGGFGGGFGGQSANGK
jgi:hypothetical protein